jgi:pyruvate formate lyase activating enzyme
MNYRNSENRIVKTKYWKKLEDDRIQCTLCPRGCKLKEGQKGFCFIRENIDNEIVMTSYGCSTGFAVDPVEKKPLYHFYPGSSVFSFGTAGCNMGCKFCQNWGITKAQETKRLSQKGLPHEIAQTAKNYGCKSVAYTYNDPVIFLEYAVDTAIECHKLGVKNIAVTAGYISKDARKDFFEHMDAANVDLKAFSESFYKKMCSSSLKDILDTLIYIKNETNVWLELTTLLIPDENDSEEELNKQCKWIVENLGRDVPVHFSAFFPSWKLMDKPRTSEETLLKAYRIARDNGILYPYTGNIHHPQTASTYCQCCQEVVIARDWNTVSEYNLNNNGECKSCGTKCAGHFD